MFSKMGGGWVASYLALSNISAAIFFYGPHAEMCRVSSYLKWTLSPWLWWALFCSCCFWPHFI